MTADELPPWEKHRRRDLEAVMAEEVPGIAWRVREMRPPEWSVLAEGQLLVSADLGVHRVVVGLTKVAARRLAHELALAVRLRDR